MRPFCSAKQNHYAILVEGILRNSCEINLSLDQWFRIRWTVLKSLGKTQEGNTVAHLDPLAQVS